MFLIVLVLALDVAEVATYSANSNLHRQHHHHHHKSVLGRRTFLTQAKKVAAGIVVSTVVPTNSKAFAISEIPSNTTETELKEDKAAAKEAEQQQRAAEKKARRLAEETKKRLAVGRIGTI